jgi:DNA-directed RNA polymerase subunit RPC12/RpoP
MAVLATPTALIQEDILCLRCGYNLRTLARSARCPECGEGVGVSLVNRRPPVIINWRRLALGAAVAAFVAAWHAAGMMGLWQWLGSALSMPQIVFALLPMMSGAALLPVAAALVAGSREAKSRRGRAQTRVCVMTAIFLTLLVIAAGAMSVAADVDAWPAFMDEAGGWIFLAMGSAFVSGVWLLDFSSLLFLRRILIDSRRRGLAAMAVSMLGLAADGLHLALWAGVSICAWRAAAHHAE